MGREDGGGSAADKAREHDRLQRQAQLEGRAEGGLTDADLSKIEESQRQQDLDRLDREALQRHDSRRRQQLLEEDRAAGAPGESIMDEVDPDNTAAMRSQGLGPDEPPQLTGGMLDALKKPENLMRLAAVGLGMIGLLLLFWGSRVEAQQVGGQATPVPQTAQPTVAQTAAAQTAAPTQAITPISAGPIVATQTGTVTAYSVENVQGTGLRYEWRHSGTCGTHSGEGTAAYSWDHPHPPCPDEPFHGSFISVQITDPRNQAVVRQYAGGSRPGRGEVPAGGGVFTAQTTPTPARTTAPATTAAATGTTVAAATSAPTVGGGVNIPLIAIALIFLIGALGLWFGGPRLAGGPVIAEPKDAEDPCAKEKARLAAAQAAAAAAEARLRELDALAESVQSTQRDAAAKEQVAENLRNGAAGGTIDGGRRVYSNPAQRAAIATAEAAAAAARAAADAAQAAYNAAGGAGARQAAADSVFTTNRELRDAQAALDACLHIVSLSTPTPAPQPTGGGATTTGGGGTTTGGTGVGIGTGTGTSDGTRTRGLCPDPPERIVSESEPLTISVADMGTTKISLSADRTSYIDLEATLEWARGLRGGLKGAGQATRLAPDVRSAMGPMGPILGFTGTMTDAALNGLDQLGDLLEGHFAGGEYSVTYTRRSFTLRCRTKETCSNGVWTRQPPELSVEEGAVDENAFVGGYTSDARNQVVGGHGTNIRGQVDRIMRRLFNQLATQNRSAQQAAERYAAQCSGQ